MNEAQKVASRVPAGLVFALCLFVTLAASLVTHRLIEREDAERFDRAAKNIVETVETRLRIYEAALLATRNLFEVKDSVSREDFHKFVAGFALQDRYPGIQGLGYTARLHPSTIVRHERAMKMAGHSDYRVWPKGDRDLYTAITYLEPLDWRNRRALGYDMFSEPVRRKAMEEARDTGLPAATGRVTLVQETEVHRQPGFLVYIPVYQNGMPVSTVDERRRALRGFVYSPFRAGDLFAQISSEVASRHRMLKIAIYDGEEESPKNLLFDSAPDESSSPSRYNTRVRFLASGHPWLIQVASASGFEIRSARHLPMFIATLGTVISILIYFVMRFAQRMNAQLLTDLAHRRRYEHEILDARKAAEEANRAKSRFLANVSHEIRTPLGVIIGFADLALDVPKVPVEIRDYLNSIKRNGHNLASLIGEVLDLSKIEANKLELESLRFSLPRLLEEVTSSLEFRAIEKGIALICGFEHQIPECVTADPTRCRQILMNLIGNAIKFTEHGEVRVTPRLRTAPEPGTPMMLEFLIEDTGIGVDTAKQIELFKPFTQADASMTRRYGGTGLGLVLSRQLARAMGGDIELLWSEPGRGSIFRFTFAGGPFEGYWLPPANRTEPTEAPKITRSLEAPRTKPLSGIRVLLVEDSADNQILVSRYLNAAGAEVEIANDGVEGVARANARIHDVVLMDIQMPRLDGHAATETLRKNGYATPIVALTAHAFKEERERALRGGFDGYLTKPLSRPALIQGILDALSSRKTLPPPTAGERFNIDI